jgi:hypothetical protein
VRIYPAHFFTAMVSFLKFLISSCTFLLLPVGALLNAAPQGFAEGHLKVIALKEVELAEENPPKFSAGNYAEYPLVILSQDGKQEIASVTADGYGNYRVALPPGNYVLDVQDRRHKHVRATPQQFTVVSNQTVRVDMDIDTGIR